MTTYEEWRVTGGGVHTAAQAVHVAHQRGILGTREDG